MHQRIFGRISEEEVTELVGTNERTQLLTRRVEKSEWNNKHLVVMAVSQFWHYRRVIRNLPEGTSVATKATKFAGFLILNGVFGSFYTNMFAVNPL